jgi:lipopolysaccharide/colanic/teichoic acid biosynthesis glycosyltransferase
VVQGDDPKTTSTPSDRRRSSSLSKPFSLTPVASTSTHSKQRKAQHPYWTHRSLRSLRKQRIIAARKKTQRPSALSRREWSDPAIDPGQVPKWKRRSDIALILMLLPAALFLLVFVSCWIKLASRGNVLFRQNRIGRGGKPFTIYKFRTMNPAAETSVHERYIETLIRSGRPMTKLDFAGDNRLIKGGCMIRMTSLDELPQLVNILRGEMSFVGPRPCMPCEMPFYDPEDHRRFTVLPGLTGLWQVARTPNTTFREMVAMDADYVLHASPWLDLTILIRTPASVLRQFTSYLKYKLNRTRARLHPSKPVRRAIAGFPETHGS